MRKLFAVVITLFMVSIMTARAEFGIGFGTRGLSWKPLPQYRIFPVFRTGLGAGYSIESFDFALTPEISANLKFIEQDFFSIYGGLGFRGFSRINIGANDDIYNFNFFFMMPIGIECNPIPDNKHLAFNVEAQVNFARSGTIDPGVYGVIELVYYLNLVKN